MEKRMGLRVAEERRIAPQVSKVEGNRLKVPADIWQAPREIAATLRVYLATCSSVYWSILKCARRFSCQQASSSVVQKGFSLP